LRKGNFEEALKETFLKMDILLMSEKGQRDLEELRNEQLAKNNTNLGGLISRVGCTSIVVLVTKEYIYVANAGDCRAVACTEEGQCKPLSKDHKPHDPLEENRILNAGGYIEGGRVNGCLNLTRAFGDIEYK
jgi:serine/threonine protein phosphatase PrpC